MTPLNKFQNRIKSPSGLPHLTGWIFLILTLTLHGALSPLKAQPTQYLTNADTVNVSLSDALQIALVNNYMLERARLSLDEADQQIREARSAVFPQINSNVSYTRNIRTPNPFAGSDANELFADLGAIGWLIYNEQQRLDGSQPISFSDFIDRRSQGLENAGIRPVGGDNPFAIENQFVMGISASQAIYNGAAFAAIRGAEHFKTIAREQLESQTQATVQQVRQAYLGALLAWEQVALLESSLRQLRETEREVRALVEQGLAARYDRNSLAVEIVNLETNLISARNGAELATRSLNIQLGIPVGVHIRLSDRFEHFSPTLPENGNLDESFRIAREHRPDLRQAEGAIRLRGEELNLTRAAYRPVVSAFADFAFLGNVPDNRDRTISDPDDPFVFSSSERNFFDTSYWNDSFAVGVRMQWSIFDGFRRRAQVQQVKLNVRRAELDALMLRESIYLEVDQALRNVESAWQRIQSQERNIELAEMNYREASARLSEGVGTRLEERQASSLLDQSRLNYLTAIHDYLIARGEYDKAIGIRTVRIEFND